MKGFHIRAKRVSLNVEEATERGRDGGRLASVSHITRAATTPLLLIVAMQE